MTGFADERKAIEQRFQTQWAAGAHSGVPVAYENVNFTPPAEANPFVALYIRSGRGNQETISDNPRLRWGGVILASVFVPVNEGTQEGREIAESAAAIFNRAQFSSGGSGRISTRVPYITPRGPDDGYMQFDVTTPYERDL